MSIQGNGDILKSRILLVEEDEAMARWARTALGGAGFTCDYAPDAATGLEKFHAHRPYLALLSLGLPNLGGIVLCPKIRAVSTVPIAVLSVRTRREDHIHALNLGADDFLVARPPDEQLVVARVLALLRRAYTYSAPPAAQSASSGVHTGHNAFSAQNAARGAEGWVTCESCGYMGPSHRFHRSGATGGQIVVCPHCSARESVRFALG